MTLTDTTSAQLPALDPPSLRLRVVNALAVFPQSTWTCREAHAEDQLIGYVPEGWLISRHWLHSDGTEKDRVEAYGMDRDIAEAFVCLLNAYPALVTAGPCAAALCEGCGRPIGASMENLNRCEICDRECSPWTLWSP